MNVEEYLYQGYAFLQEGNPGQTEENCLKVLSLDPDNAIAFYLKGKSWESRMKQIRNRLSLYWRLE